MNKFQARFIESVKKKVIDGIEKNKNKFSFKKYRFLYFKNCLSNFFSKKSHSIYSILRGKIVFPLIQNTLERFIVSTF